MHSAQQLSFSKQMELFKSRGMTVSEEQIQNPVKVQTIGYYKLKKIAMPFYDYRTKTYHDISFNQVITRFYLDKNLRIHLLHAIEKIEISLKVNISYILGEMGPFEYLNFQRWTSMNHQSDSNRTFGENKFINGIKKSAKKAMSGNHDLQDSINFNDKNMPTVWLACDLLMMGGIKWMIDEMSPTKLIKLANCYDCTPNQLKSWVGLVAYARNICAHNGEMVNFEARTSAVLLDEWKEHLYSFERNEHRMYSNRISSLVFVIKQLVDKINPNYQWDDIAKDLVKISKPSHSYDEKATFNLNGFNSINDIRYLFPKCSNKVNRVYKNFG